MLPSRLRRNKYTSDLMWLFMGKICCFIGPWHTYKFITNSVWMVGMTYYTRSNRPTDQTHGMVSEPNSDSSFYFHLYFYLYPCRVHRSYFLFNMHFDNICAAHQVPAGQQIERPNWTKRGRKKEWEKKNARNERMILFGGCCTFSITVAHSSWMCPSSSSILYAVHIFLYLFSILLYCLFDIILVHCVVFSCVCVQHSTVDNIRIRRT